MPSEEPNTLEPILLLHFTSRPGDTFSPLLGIFLEDKSPRKWKSFTAVIHSSNVVLHYSMGTLLKNIES